MRLKATRILVAILLVMFGIILLVVPTTDTSRAPEDLSQISYRDVEKDQIYYVEDLLMADQFAVLNDNDVVYMMVMFQDQDGKVVAANMPLNDSSPIWDDVQDYLSDDSQSIGDYSINCYVKAETDYDVEDKLNDLFAEGVQRMRGEMLQSIYPLGLRFDYVCDEDGDPYAIAEASETFKIVVAVMVFIGAALLFFGTFRKPKQQKQAARVSNYAADYPRQTGVPQSVPQVQQATPMGTFQTTAQPAQSNYTYVQQPATQSYAQAQVTQQPTAAPNTGDVMAQLNHYKMLKDAGYMSEAEFEQKRKELLGL